MQGRITPKTFHFMKLQPDGNELILVKVITDCCWSYLK